MSNFIFATGIVIYLMFRFPNGSTNNVNETHDKFTMTCVAIFLVLAAIADLLT